MVWNPTDDYAYVNGRKTVLKVGLNKQYLFVNGQWQTTDREDKVPTSPTFGQGPDGGIEIVNGLLDMSNITPGHMRSTQIVVENQGKPIVVKYRTDPSSSVTEEEIRFDTQLYNTTYITLTRTAVGNPATYYNRISLYNTRQTSCAWNATTFKTFTNQSIYISEIYVDA